MLPPNMVSFLSQVNELEIPEQSHPYIYSDKSMMTLFLYGF